MQSTDICEIDSNTILTIQILIYLISERVEAYNSIWVVGDDFVSETVGEFLQAEDATKPYIREHYDVKILCSTSLSPTNRVIARLHNNVVNGLRENPLLPKAIVFVLDGDIIKTVHHQEMGMLEIFEIITRNLVSDIHRVILSHKEKLPIRALKQEFPTSVDICTATCQLPG